MLRIEEIGPDGIRDEMRDDLGQQPCLPAKIDQQQHRDAGMHQKGEQTVEMLPRLGDKRPQAHAMQEHKQVAKENGQRMTHEKVDEARRFGCLLIVRLVLR